jgi:hypothetical protein
MELMILYVKMDERERNCGEFISVDLLEVFSEGQ